MFKNFVLTNSSKYFFFILLALYFVLDGSNRYAGLVSAPVVFKLFLLIVLFSVLTFRGLHIRLSAERSFLLTAWLTILYLFFSILLNALTAISILRVLHKPIWYLSFFFVATVVYTIYLLLSSNQSLRKQIQFLFLVTCTLLMIEILKFLIPAFKVKQNYIKTDELVFQPVNQAALPSIYLFVMDEYGSFESISRNFGFDNNPFKDSLLRRNFFVASNPSSNYNLTWLSCLSMLEMSYISNQTPEDYKSKSIFGKSEIAIKDNNLVRFFNQNKYRITNNTFFSFRNHKHIPFEILPVNERLLTDKTFSGHISQSLLNTIPVNDLQIFLNTQMARYYKYNEKVMSSTYEELHKTDGPVFMYSHFIMPHTPFLKDKEGGVRKFSDAFKEKKSDADKNYIQYLQYANSELIKMVDLIQQKQKNAIIIIASDHGNRMVQVRDRQKDYDNILAIYTSDKNYSGLTNSTCTVNLFRILLNRYFNQSLPLLECKKFDVAKGHI